VTNLKMELNFIFLSYLIYAFVFLWKSILKDECFFCWLLDTDYCKDLLDD
ncbi:hypothetical protein ABZP36_028283, partial [Zizania latifolia]